MAALDLVFPKCFNNLLGHWNQSTGWVICVGKMWLCMKPNIVIAMQSIPVCHQCEYCRYHHESGSEDYGGGSDGGGDHTSA